MPALPPAVRALPRVAIKGNMLPKTPALQFERIIHRDRAAGCGLRAHPCLIATTPFRSMQESARKNPVPGSAVLMTDVFAAFNRPGRKMVKGLSCQLS